MDMNWTPSPNQPLAISSASMDHALADIMAWTQSGNLIPAIGSTQDLYTTAPLRQSCSSPLDSCPNGILLQYSSDDHHIPIQGIPRQRRPSHNRSQSCYSLRDLDPHQYLFVLQDNLVDPTANALPNVCQGELIPAMPVFSMQPLPPTMRRTQSLEAFSFHSNTSRCAADEDATSLLPRNSLQTGPVSSPLSLSSDPSMHTFGGFHPSGLIFDHNDIHTAMSRTWDSCSSSPTLSQASSYSPAQASAFIAADGFTRDSPSPSPPSPQDYLSQPIHSPSTLTAPFPSSTSSSPAPPRSHKKEKPRFICPIPGCSRTFSRPFNLKSHGLTHEAHRPHACEVCPKTFSRIHDRDRHMRSHENVKPHSCIVCLGRFARKDAVIRHLKLSKETNACSWILKANNIPFKDVAAGLVSRTSLGEEANIQKTLAALEEHARMDRLVKNLEWIGSFPKAPA